MPPERFWRERCESAIWCSSGVEMCGAVAPEPAPGRGVPGAWGRIGVGATMVGPGDVTDDEDDDGGLPLPAVSASARAASVLARRLGVGTGTEPPAAGRVSCLTK